MPGRNIQALLTLGNLFPPKALRKLTFFNTNKL
jgi:hypothetical protein